jgi:alkylation response protein AidB-like acyl-CoA dehydrogenase
MHLDYTAEQQAFRREVGEFIAAKLPPDIARRTLEHKHLEPGDIRTWQRILHERGWGAPGWPKAAGGAGWDPIRRHIFEEECVAAGAPRQLDFSISMVGPVIIAFGTPAQQQYFLPRILSGEHWWCQGYSEPGSGSDLASLKTRAQRQGEHYVVNGQKTWNTLGQYADWIFCLVRTDGEARQQEGISFLLIDMKTPGITVRPIVMLDGSTEINDIFFDDVKVPVDNRIGEENKGWTYAKFLLSHERVGIANVPRSKKMLERLKAIAREERANGRPLIEDARFRDRIAQVEIDLAALEITLLRVLSAEARKRSPGPESSILKIRGSEIGQALYELTMQACGYSALPYFADAHRDGWTGTPVGGAHAPAAAPEYFNMRKTTIYGGSNEIQKNIIAKMVLGL